MSKTKEKPGPDFMFEEKLEKRFLTLLTKDQCKQLDDYCATVKASRSEVIRTALECIGVLKLK